MDKPTQRQTFIQTHSYTVIEQRCPLYSTWIISILNFAMYTVKYGQKYDVSKPTVIFKLSLCCLIAWLLPRRPWEMKLNRLFFRLSMPAIKGTMSVRMACDSFKSLVHFFYSDSLKRNGRDFLDIQYPNFLFFSTFSFCQGWSNTLLVPF